MNYKYSTEAIVFQFELVLKKGNSWPVWEFDQPGQLIDETATDHQKNITVQVALNLNSNKIILKRSGKNSSDVIIENGIIVRDQVLKINKIWINDVLLEPFPVNSIAKFYPQYSQDDIDYGNQNNLVLEKSKHTMEFFYNGEWHFEFQQPFFIWYNQILLDDLSASNFYWTQQNHLGFVNEDNLKRLELLLDKLS